jgi:hypothetical protein
MYKLKLNYNSLPADSHNKHSLQDVLTETACTLLLLNHNIHTSQEDHCTIVFESDRDRTLAYLKLQNNTQYTPRYLD